MMRNEIMNNIEWLCDRQLAVSYATQEMYQRFGAGWEDTDDVIAYVNEIAGIKISAFLREDKPEEIKLSLRTKEEIDVCRIAKLFGGGGHIRASGATLRMPLALAKQQVAKALVAAIA